jgi:hypothetical protein
MADKQCAACGEMSPPGIKFCSSCGASEFKDIPPNLAARLADRTEIPASDAVRIALGRVILVSVLSGGLYLLYWSYLTWKQLASEATEKHYPVWHAITLLVPIYGLFRMHRHVTVIQGLAANAGLATSLSPVVAVVLWIVSNVLSWSSLKITEPVALIAVGLLTTALTTALIVMAQEGLNGYWGKVKGASLQDTPIGVGEVIFVLLGLALWSALLFGD